MKVIKHSAGVMLLAVFTALALGSGTMENTTMNAQPSSASATSTNSATPQAEVQPPSPFWTGEGGKGSSIAILAPQASGLAENQSYLPVLVQGELVSAFSTYSAISVLDRMNLDEQYAELLSGYYDDEAQESWDLGHLPPTTYMTGGRITRTSTGYALQMRVTRNADKMTAASYSGTCTFDELDNLTAIRQASLDLLEKINIVPTDRTRTELARAAPTNHVNAQTALSQGIIAQRQGTEVAALSYFYQAVAFEPTLLEAVNRSSIIAANISSGNIRENARNDIEWRRQWVTRLTETEQYFDNLYKTESVPYTLFYSSEIKQGEINYQNETIALSFETNLHSTDAWLLPLRRVVQEIYNGLVATERRSAWGLSNWPWTSLTTPNLFDSRTRRSKNFSIAAELLNDRNQVIGRQTFQTSGSWGWENQRINDLLTPTIVVDNDNKNNVSFAVKVDDITENLTIRIVSVNGTNADTAARNGVLQIVAMSGEEYDANKIWRFSFGAIAGGNYVLPSNLTIPEIVWGEKVTSFVSGYSHFSIFTSITLPDSVTYIGTGSFSSHDLTRITIPNNVTYIGREAFGSNSRLSSITIGSNVTIEKGPNFLPDPWESFARSYNGIAGTYTRSPDYDQNFNYNWTRK